MENMKLLRSSLRDKIVTKATPSVRSKVINLNEVLVHKNNEPDQQKIDMNLLVEKMCLQFWKANFTSWSLDHLFKYVNPETLPVLELLNKDLTELRSWNYVYGHTPKFKLNVNLSTCEIEINVENGLIKSYEFSNSNLSQKDRENFDIWLLGAKLCQLDLQEKFDNLKLKYATDPNLNSLLNFINTHL
jgi:hypothetical protein